MFKQKNNNIKNNLFRRAFQNNMKNTPQNLPRNMNTATDKRKKYLLQKEDIHQELTPSANVERDEFLNVIGPEVF